MASSDVVGSHMGPGNLNGVVYNGEVNSEKSENDSIEIRVNAIVRWPICTFHLSISELKTSYNSAQ